MHNLVSVAQCLEKGRAVVREIRQIDKLPEQVLHIYDRIRECNLVTGWESPLTLEQLLGPDTVVWQVDDVGMICLYLGEVAHVHVFFWDQRLRGREKMCRLHAAKILREFGLVELYTAMPRDADVITAFARRVGFKTHQQHPTHLVLRATSKSLHEAARS